MKSWIISNTHFFKVEELVKIHFNQNYLYHSKSEAELDSLIPVENFWPATGAFFEQTLIDNPFFIKEKECQSEADAQREGLDSSGTFELLFLALWFVRDHCATIGSIVTAMSNGYLKLAIAGLTYTKANGRIADTSFALDDFLRAMEYMSLILKFHKQDVAITYPNDLTEYDKRLGPGHFIEYNESNRPARALTFLELARQSIILPQKISFYVLVLECLFSANDSTEIQHKLSERIALYMSNDFQERKKIYDDVKLFYTIRSKYIHGQAMESKFKTIAQLTAYSVQLDVFVRELLKKVILQDSEIFSRKDDALKAWFSELIFRNPGQSISDDSTPIA